MLRFFFFLSLYFSFIHPQGWELIATQTLLDSISPTVTNSLPVRECKPSHSISLLPSLLSYLTPPSLSLARSLSHCGGLQGSTIPDWSSVMGLTLSSSAREGISFCSDSIHSALSLTVISLYSYLFFLKHWLAKLTACCRVDFGTRMKGNQQEVLGLVFCFCFFLPDSPDTCCAFALRGMMRIGTPTPTPPRQVNLAPEGGRSGPESRRVKTREKARYRL